MKKILCATVASLALAVSCLVGADSKVLTAEIEHSERLAPLDPNLVAGQVFDPDKLPASDSEGANNWYKIPDWLAGTWHKDEQTDYYRYSYKTNLVDTTTRTETARSDGTWGTQRDEKGIIWQFDPAPFNATVDSGDQFVVQVIRVSEPLEVTPQKFMRRSVDTQIRVAKANGVIQSVESGEQLTTYSPDGEGLLKRETSAKVFDFSGEPVLLGKSFASERRVKDFASQDFYKGKDMKLLFQEFLKKQTETALAQ